MIVVTGASGFIGSNIVRRLNIQGRSDIICVDNTQREVVKDLNYDKWLSVEDFFNNFRDWYDVDVIYHEGAISSTTERNLDLIKSRNQDPTCYLIDRAVEYGFLLSYASSASVYGDGPIFREDQKLDPRSPYAQSKANIDYYTAITLLAHPKAKIQGWRYFNVYGNGESHKGSQASPIHKFSKQAEIEGMVSVFKGSENFYRDFICVDDISNIKIKAKDWHNGLFNLGTGQAISFRQVAELVAKKYSCDIKEIEFPKELEGQYQYYTKADTTKLRKLVDEYQFISVEDFLS